MAKSTQRLEYARLAEAIAERGLVEVDSLQSVLQQSQSTGELFPDLLVRESLISDWELSRVVCEVFNLPFLTLDFYTPAKEALELLDRTVLHQHGVVLLDRYASLLTVAMPALSPSEVLSMIGDQTGTTVVPVVGTVLSNRRWLEENLPLQEEFSIENVDPALPVDTEDAGEWGQLFDDGNAAVMLDLEQQLEQGGVDLDGGGAPSTAPSPPPE